MNKILLCFIVLSISSFGCKSDSATEPPNGPPAEKWELIWYDEFEVEGHPDSTKWSYEVGGHGWGNQELQYYTEKRLQNCRVEDGALIIEARKENWEGKNYTSTRLVSRYKGDWTYGRFEISAVLPKGRGTWPAIWMLATDWTYGNGGWPANGEIDIMEYVGYNPGKVHASIHCQKYYHSIGTQKSSVINVPDAETAYHLYALEWTPEEISVFVDSTKYFTFQNEGLGWESWPFDKDFFLLLNIAIGGSWGGQQGVDDSIFPQYMIIDYVRVYQLNEE
jgi:beta-glucanase (GH16 family)